MIVKSVNALDLRGGVVLPLSGDSLRSEHSAKSRLLRSSALCKRATLQSLLASLGEERKKERKEGDGQRVLPPKPNVTALFVTHIFLATSQHVI